MVLAIPLRCLRTLIAVAVCVLALALPYRARLYYFQLISYTVHLPFRLFGKLARFILRQTQTENPYAH